MYFVCDHILFILQKLLFLRWEVWDLYIGSQLLMTLSEVSFKERTIVGGIYINIHILHIQLLV